MPDFFVDFTTRGGSPLFKKFHMFNSGLVPVSEYLENLDALRRIRPTSIRIDLFLGDRRQEFGDVIDGTMEQPVFHFEKLDGLAELLIKEGIKPYWCWCYVPLPLQPPGGTFKDGPTDFRKFGEFMEELSRHYRKAGLSLGWQEVFNEADCFDNLYAGTFADYLQMYEYGAPALKRADEQAAVGGPAEAFQEPADSVEENLRSFIRLVTEKKLPLDFFSFHSYGYENREYLERTAFVQKLLEEKGGFERTELHMNELNVLPPPWDYGKTPLTNETVVPLILNCIQELLEIHDLTAVHWAQLLNSGVDELSLVSPEGIYYPAFYVFEVYNRMPVGRCPIVRMGEKRTEETGRAAAEPSRQIEGNIRGMASSGPNRDGILLWNDGEETSRETFELRGLCGKYLDIYVCDSTFYARAKTKKRLPLIRRERIPVSGGRAVLSAVLEPFSMIYAECNGAAPISEKRLICGRQLYRFTERGHNDSYACLESQDQTFYLGTGGKSRELLFCGVQLCQKSGRLRFRMRSNRPAEAERALTVRVYGNDMEKAVLHGKEIRDGFLLPEGAEPVWVIAELHGAKAGLWVEMRLS